MQSFVLLVVLILLNAVFASAEIAVISMSETRLKKLASDGDGRARALVELTAQPAKFLATIQVAITLAGQLQSAVAAENFSGPLVQGLVDLGVTIPVGVLKGVSIFCITLILGYFNLIFGELVPKRIAMKKSESMALGMARLLAFISRAFAPLVWLLTASTNLVLRLLGMSPEEEEETVTEEELRMLMNEGNEKGTILTEENEIIQNVFAFNDICVEEICTHRRDVKLLLLSDAPQKWEEVIGSSRHTYYPVCGKDQDDVIGVLNTRDYFRQTDKSRENLLAKAMEDQVLFVPERMKANVLFGRMKQSRTYFAVILDEYGGLSGIITLHDLMEALVGELEEKEEPVRPADIEQLPDGSFSIQGCAALDEVAKALEYPFPVDEYETFSGFVCGMIGRVPGDGETFRWQGNGLIIDVRSVRGHIIREAVVRLNTTA